MKNSLTYGILAVSMMLIMGCKKDFLEAKPTSGIISPNSLTELEGLLENAEVLTKSTPALSQMAADDYIFTSYESWLSTRTATERNSYVWAKDIFEGKNRIRDWSSGYSGIFYCNNVLEVLTKIPETPATSLQYRTVKGWALFMRAYLLYDLVRNFSAAYDANTASAELGIPLPLKPEIDVLVQRASLKQTYDQILSDLQQAARLLDLPRPANSNRPGKAAAYALFARIYLSMRSYGEAELYADSTLAISSKLIDYNTISKTATSPFLLNNDESIFSTGGIFEDYGITAPSGSNTEITVNPELLQLYHKNDLRLTTFFRLNSTTGNLYFRRGYYLQSTPYTGLATDELYLIKAECLVRRNQVAESLGWLNALLVKRFPPGNYTAIQGLSQDAALQTILLERRKELVWRSLRWTDLKRLNKEGANITLSRSINGQQYTLPPNDPRYIFPIPDDEIALSGIQQNIR
jgi:hypothetical protein